MTREKKRMRKDMKEEWKKTKTELERWRGEKKKRTKE